MKKLNSLFTCLLISTIYLSAQCSLDVTTSDPTCGDDNGEALIFINNGIAPYEYNIFGQTENTSDNPIFIPGLSEGIYSVTVTDNNGCQEVIDFSIIGEIPMIISIITVDATCDVPDGCIEVFVEGGTPPFTYQWNDPSQPNTSAACGLSAGTYSIIVTDANGCVSEIIGTINNIPGADVFITEDIIDCNTSILVASTSVNNPDFLWSTNANGGEIQVVAAGDYSVTVVDLATGCAATSTYTYIGGNLFFQPSILNISCFGNNDGEISGNFPNTINPNVSWTGPNGFASNMINISELEVGAYTMVADDGMGCMNTFGPYIISEPEEIQLAFAVTTTTCFGTADGFIDLTVTGGTPPYTYEWSDGNIVEDPIGLNANNYNVTVTDSNGCTESVDVDIVDPPELEITITSSDQSCLNDGQASATVSGGAASYIFNWSTGETTNEIFGLIAGTYSLTVTDNNGCFATQDFTIESPIDLEVTSTFTNCNTNDGTATATILGGSTSPTFAWSNGETTAIVTDLVPDWYSVTVTDGVTDCQVHQNIQVQEDSICYVVIDGYVYIDDITQDCVVDAETIPGAYVRVELSDGQVVFTNNEGYYKFITDAGTYTISIDTNPNLEALCSSPIVIDALEWGMTFSDNNFFLKYSELIDIRLKVVKFNARPGFTQTVRICLMNRGAAPASGTLTFTHPDVLDFISSNPMETGYDSTTNMVTYDYVDIPPNTTWIYNPQLQVPVTTPLGTPLDYTFSAPMAGDINPLDNGEACTILVTGSYDPNDKAVAPAGIGPEGIISMDDTKLSYKVRFQNTGTDTAFTVLIRDTLDANLDWRTFEPGPASHDYVASIVDGNIVELLFENILLPDSFVNEPASNGFVIFDIDIKEGSPYGTRIENTAGIYFDFNPPIITNTVQNLIQMIVDVEEKNVPSLLLETTPNPTSSSTRLSFDLEESKVATIALYDSQGHLVKIVEEGILLPVGKQNVEISLQDLLAGIYFVRLTTNDGEVGLTKILKF